MSTPTGDADRRTVVRLSEQLLAMQRDIDMLKEALHTPRLAHSSIEDDFLEINDADGNLRVAVGRQPDDTFGVAHGNGPPPPAPTAPRLAALGAALLVGWDGLFTAGAARPADFRMVEVEAGDDTAGWVKTATILDREGDGGQAAVPCDGPTGVRLVAVSLSGVRSEPSTVVEGTPGPVVAQDLVDAIVGTQHLTPDLSDSITVAATQAAQAILDAATAQATADGAITTFFQEDPPTGLDGTTDLGDLWYKTSTQQAHRWDGAQWLLIQDNAIAEALAAAQNAQDTADGKIDSYFSDTAPTGAAAGDLWFKSNEGNRQYRWNGTAWVALPFGTEALVTRSITALLIAVNAIQAEHIQVGAVTAAKLAAQLVLASTIVAGTPGGARVEISPSGLVQYDANQEPVVSFGASPNANYLSVLGADGNPLAALDATGHFSVQRLSVATDELSIGGALLADVVDSSPGRVVSWVQPLGAGQETQLTYTNSAPFIITTLSFDAAPGRLYKICTNPVLARSNALAIGFRYTTDGTAPTTGSPLLQETWIGANLSDSCEALFQYAGATAATVRVALTMRGSGNNQARAAGVSTGQAGVQFWVQDAGSGAAAGSAARTSWTPTYTYTWDDINAPANTARFRSANEAVQGSTSGAGHRATMIGFDHAAIRATLAGKTINKVELYLYSPMWVDRNGGVVCIGSHNNATAPAQANNTYRGIVGFNLWQKQMWRAYGTWINLPVSIGEQLRDNQIKGLTLDAIFAGRYDTYAGSFRARGEQGQPTLRITYT